MFSQNQEKITICGKVPPKIRKMSQNPKKSPKIWEMLSKTRKIFVTGGKIHPKIRKIFLRPKNSQNLGSSSQNQEKIIAWETIENFGKIFQKMFAIGKKNILSSPGRGGSVGGERGWQPPPPPHSSALRRKDPALGML